MKREHYNLEDDQQRQQKLTYQLHYIEKPIDIALSRPMSIFKLECIKAWLTTYV